MNQDERREGHSVDGLDFADDFARDEFPSRNRAALDSIKEGGALDYFTQEGQQNLQIASRISQPRAFPACKMFVYCTGPLACLILQNNSASDATQRALKDTRRRQGWAPSQGVARFRDSGSGFSKISFLSSDANIDNSIAWAGDSGVRFLTCYGAIVKPEYNVRSRNFSLKSRVL